LNGKLIEFGIYQLTAEEKLFPVGGNGRKIKLMPLEISVRILFVLVLIIAVVQCDLRSISNNLWNKAKENI